MFAAFVLERDPFRFADFPTGFVYWIQVVGALAMIGLCFWALAGLPYISRAERERFAGWRRRVFLSSIGLAVVCYTGFALIALFTLRTKGADVASAGAGQKLREGLLTAG